MMEYIRSDSVLPSSKYFLLYCSQFTQENKNSPINSLSKAKIRNCLIEDFELDKDTIDFLDLDLGIISDDSSASPCLSAISSFENDDFLCHLCHKTFKTHKGLQQHLGKQHTKSKEVVSCDICGKKFKHKYAVKFHINQVHDKITRVSCPICGKSVYNKYILSQHMAKHAEGEMP
ncbi:unnamed protein product [Blepharisma stoltei]|uniref:C2H2-type domain-containing protein n=1 Tax=Blepharisma stoltei TaxID=1481888 RepID=A0AAU9K3E4_9CILI|nr:unnamed protein product [Blepharisma stoltei]